MGRVVKDMGPDPDPTEYLFVSLEQKRIDQTKPYDGKKATWVPDEKEGFALGEIKGTKGDLVVVGLAGGEVSFQISFSSTESKISVSIEFGILNRDESQVQSIFCSSSYAVLDSIWNISYIWHNDSNLNAVQFSFRSKGLNQ